LPERELRLDNPTGDPIVRSRGARLHIIAPFSTTSADGRTLTHHIDAFDHSATVDNAPKVLVKAPSGDFAFGTSAKIYRTIFTPWAGGYATGKTVWGRDKSARAADVTVPDFVRNKWPAPEGDTYKFAFIIVAASEADVTADMIDRADAVRRYWDAAFEAATAERRHSNSTL
jgi:hypothetical protein